MKRWKKHFKRRISSAKTISVLILRFIDISSCPRCPCPGAWPPLALSSPEPPQPARDQAVGKECKGGSKWLNPWEKFGVLIGKQQTLLWLFKAPKAYCMQRKIIALNRQGTQQQRPQLPTLTAPGMRVNSTPPKVHPLIWECSFGGIYIPCIYSHARWRYRRRFRSSLLCPLSVERC